MPFPLFLNELSLSIQDAQKHGKVQLILAFINTLKAIKQKRSDIELHNSTSLYESDLGGGDFLCTILIGANYTDQWRFIKNLAQRAPWDIQHLNMDVLIDGQKPIGVTLALDNNSLTISLASGVAWKNDNIVAVVAGEKVEVPNISDPSHTNKWDSLIREYGFAASASAIVFDGEFKALLYQREHNPPHVHIEFEEYKATINLRNLDTLAGRLPSHISSNVNGWIEQNREVLLDGWERCRNGQKPLLV